MRTKLLGSALALALLAAGCGGDSGGSASGTTEDRALIDQDLSQAIDDDTGTTAEGATTTIDADAVEEPTTMEEWEELWANEREAVVARIKENGWGLQADGTTVLGPEGFNVDTSACTSGWNDVEGLTDTEIRFGATAPASGTQATAIGINNAMTVIFDYYASKGLFTDINGKNRKVLNIIKDDGYDPARTIPLVDELIDSDRVFAIVTQGTPSTLKVYDKLNSRCIPHFFNSTGHPAWGDPVNHPWTSGMLLAYNIEALLWGKFIDDRISEFPEGKITIAALVMNNDFGKVYDAAFRSYLAESPNKDRYEYFTETNEPQAATITDPMTTLAAKDPSVFIAMQTGTPCSQAITEAAQNGMNQSVTYKFMPSVCKGLQFVGRETVGESSDGWWIMGGGQRDLASPGEDDNAYVKWARDELAKAGHDYRTNSFYGWGLNFGWSWSQVFMIAGQLDGGLTRTNVLTAARTVDMTPAGYLWGIKANMNGNADAYWIEGSEIAQYDSASQQWIQQGDIIELSGRSKTCAWDPAASACR